MGVFSRIFGTLDITSLLQIQKELSNGTLISELVSTIFNVKINGLFKDPKTEATALGNIRKSLDILRRQGKMSQKFTWCDKELLEGHIRVFLGLLEDLHRCFDGLPPRKRGLNYFQDGPYLGDTLYEETKPKPEILQPLVQNTINQDVKVAPVREDNIAKKIDGLIEKSKYQDLPSIFKNHKFLIGDDSNANDNKKSSSKENQLSPKRQ